MWCVAKGKLFPEKTQETTQIRFLSGNLLADWGFEEPIHEPGAFPPGFKRVGMNSPIGLTHRHGVAPPLLR